MDINHKTINSWKHTTSFRSKARISSQHNSLRSTEDLHLRKAFKHISAGEKHIMCTDFEGSMWLNSFRSNDSARIAAQTTFWRKIVKLKGVLSIMCGESHFAIVDQEGNLWTWGCNRYGQLGQPDESTISSRLSNPVKLSLPVKFKAVSASSSNHTLALDDDGFIWACGNNYNGQVGNNSLDNCSHFIKLPIVEADGTPTKFTSLSVSANFSLAIDTVGHVWGWGDNTARQIGNMPDYYLKTPVKIKGLNDIIEVSAGSDFSLALDKYGRVFSWGNNNSGQLGYFTNTTSANCSESQNFISSLTNVVSIRGGEGFALALTESGLVYGWGNNTYGQLGLRSKVPNHAPQKIEGLPSIASIDIGSNYSIAIDHDGKLWAWGRNLSNHENKTRLGDYHIPQLIG